MINSDMLLLILLACVCALLVTTIFLLCEVYKLEDRVSKLRKDNNKLKQQVESLVKRGCNYGKRLSCL